MGISQEYDAQVRILSGNSQPGAPNRQSLGASLEEIFLYSPRLRPRPRDHVDTRPEPCPSLRHEQSTEKTKNNLGQ
jgi:hypothetical protein